MSPIRYTFLSAVIVGTALFTSSSFSRAAQYQVFDKGDPSNTGTPFNVEAWDSKGGSASTGSNAILNALTATSKDGVWNSAGSRAPIVSDTNAPNDGISIAIAPWSPKTRTVPVTPPIGPNTVPEPSTYALLISGLGLLYFMTFRRQAAKAKI
jgi:hypothetical protein